MRSVIAASRCLPSPGGAGACPACAFVCTARSRVAAIDPANGGKRVGNNPVRSSLTSSGTEARRARGLVSGACEGLPEELIDKARLLTSELVTNALMYGSGELEMRVRASPDEVSVEVFDQSDEDPHLLPLDPDLPRGSGLRLVEAIASNWGVSHFPRGKAVWFVVR